jgi:hypothetical protein
VLVSKESASGRTWVRAACLEREVEARCHRHRRRELECGPTPDATDTDAASRAAQRLAIAEFLLYDKPGWDVIAAYWVP